MYGQTYYTRTSFGFGRPWTPMVRMLILVNVGVFLAQLVAHQALVFSFGLNAAHPFHLWRYVTYLFLHGGPWHLFINMLLLWILGSDMEDYFGSKQFLRYYFFTGVGAGFLQVLIHLLMGQQTFVIGASGAIFGIILAFGIVYAERTITLLLFFVLPISMKAKHMAIVLGIMEFFLGVSPGSTGVAHFAHLGGMAFGLLYLKTPLASVRVKGPGLVKNLRERFDTARSEHDDRRMDELLRKVNKQGIQSLTEEEKQFLHRISRRKKWQ